MTGKTSGNCPHCGQTCTYRRRLRRQVFILLRPSSSNSVASGAKNPSFQSILFSPKSRFTGLLREPNIRMAFALQMMRNTPSILRWCSRFTSLRKPHTGAYSAQQLVFTRSVHPRAVCNRCLSSPRFSSLFQCRQHAAVLPAAAHERGRLHSESAG